MVTKENLKKYADKLMFDMKDSEYEILLNEFDTILKNMELIYDIDNIDNVEPMHFPYELDEVILRDDKITYNIPSNEVTQNAKEVINGQVKIPKVVD